MKDTDLYSRILGLGGATFVHVPKALANVRIHEKDRKVHNHTPENESRQRSDSVALVQKARAFLAANASKAPRSR